MLYVSYETFKINVLYSEDMDQNGAFDSFACKSKLIAEAESDWTTDLPYKDSTQNMACLTFSSIMIISET